MRDSFYPLYLFLLPRPYSIFYHLYSVLYPNPQSRHLFKPPLPSSTSTSILNTFTNPKSSPFSFLIKFYHFTFIKKAIRNLLHRGESINLQFFIESTRNQSPEGSYDNIVFSRRGHLHLLGWLIAPSCMEVFWL